MKLYYSPGACSLSPHIVAHEAGLPFTLERVDLKTKHMAGGADFLALNPKGYVPAIEMEDGELLTEGPTIVQYIADRAPERGLIPPAGTRERYRVLEMLGYINSEIHKAYGPLFRPDSAPELRAQSEATLRKRYALLDARLATGPYLFGEAFTVADAYLFTVTHWAGFLKLDLADFPHLVAFQARVAARPAVQAALAAEGLKQASVRTPT